MTDSSAIWLVAHTRPRCEKKVVRYCKDMGVSVYQALRTSARLTPPASGDTVPA